MTNVNRGTNSKSADLLRQAAVVLATIATIAYNGVSQALPVGGRTSADVSNQYATFFTPANYAFSIWGVIYLLLAAFTVYQALPGQRENPSLRRIGWLFVLSCIFNCTWITLFQYDLILPSVAVIVAFLLTLIAIYLRLHGRRAAASTAERWLVRLPFSVYLGWLSVATIANVAVLGVAQNWRTPLGIPGPTWAAIMLAVATMLGVIMAAARRDIGFVAVLVWAFAAIIDKQAGIEVITTTALIATIVLVVTLAGSLVFANLRSLTRPSVAAD